jgi:hypothetical protein
MPPEMQEEECRLELKDKEIYAEAGWQKLPKVRLRKLQEEECRLELKDKEIHAEAGWQKLPKVRLRKLQVKFSVPTFKEVILDRRFD